MAAEWNQPKAPKWAHNLPGPGIRELNFINRNPGIFGRNVIPEIKRITFWDHLPEKKGISFDISKERKLTVMACLSKNREDLYIGADGGINAADICGHLFEGLKHLEQIVFTWDSFHTDFTESFFPYVQGLYEPENAQRHILQDLESGFFSTICSADAKALNRLNSGTFISIREKNGESFSIRMAILTGSGLLLLLKVCSADAKA